jgi:hypothetical protein
MTAAEYAKIFIGLWAINWLILLLAIGYLT